MLFARINAILINLILIALIECYITNPGPYIKATKGEVWPKPQNQEKHDNFFVIRPNSFSFKSESSNCVVFLQTLFSRYWKIINNANSLDKRGRYVEKFLKTKYNKSKSPLLNSDKFTGYLDILSVDLTGSCEESDYPSLNSSEHYNLNILNNNEASLSSESIWGILRGLETFSQLIYFQDDLLLINATTIDDYPRFNHRGLLLDTSRHFIPLYAILNTLEAMSYNKFNVFHWHIVDDQSFPYKSITYPELSDKGAYHPVSRVYEQIDIQKVIEFARIRGIRVLVEFDTPGHTRSWGEAFPEILTACYNGSETTGQLGPMNPINNSTYEFLEEFFEEIVQVFPDPYIHLGGDEVEFECWQSNEKISTFMSQNNITTYAQLESYFIQKLLLIVQSLNKNQIVWQEVFDNGVNTPNSTLIHVWKENGLETLKKVVQSGKLALYSSCWYLDHVASGGDWLKFYKCEPFDFDGAKEDKERILGGEACMWSESVDENNLASRVWPRASATAEKLWSAQNVTDIEDAAKRLEEHACRLNHRGIRAQPPNGPGVCL